MNRASSAGGLRACDFTPWPSGFSLPSRPPRLEPCNHMVSEVGSLVPCHSTWLVKTFQFLLSLPPVAGSPAPFSFHDAGEWLSWLQQFEDYAFATGMHAAPYETRVRTLLYCVGPRARIVLSSLMSDKDAYKS
ncbi:hypothetical protein MTO96_017702 [Rhipicephalus appendiculatus]